jgi:hypothetical protein
MYSIGIGGFHPQLTKRGRTLESTAWSPAEPRQLVGPEPAYDGHTSRRHRRGTHAEGGRALRGPMIRNRGTEILGTGTGLGQFDWVRPRLYTRHKNTNRAARARSHAGSVYIVVSKRNVAVTSENRARKFAVATDAHAPEPKDEGEHKHVTSGDRVVGRDIYHTQYHITLFEYVSPA